MYMCVNAYFRRHSTNTEESTVVKAAIVNGMLEYALLLIPVLIKVHFVQVSLTTELI